MHRASVVSALLLGGCCLGSIPGLGGPVTAVGPGFAPDPMLIAGTAGGPSQAASSDANCRGWLPFLPNHTLQVSAPMPFLRVMVASSTDTTLFVRLADGRVVCNDDADGTNPAVDLPNLPAGAHQIYVGTFAQGGSAPYTLGLSSSPAMTPTLMTAQPGLGPPPPPPPPPPPGDGLGFTVAFVSGNLPGVTAGTTCIATQSQVPAPAAGAPDCRWVVQCGGVTVYGDGDGGYVRCADPTWPPGTRAFDANTTGVDRDPSLIINAGGLMVRDDASGPRGEFQITGVLSPVQSGTVPSPG